VTEVIFPGLINYQIISISYLLLDPRQILFIKWQDVDIIILINGREQNSRAGMAPLPAPGGIGPGNRPSSGPG
jgi:hypothetical protein